MNNKGFTLIELLVVVLIIGILAAMALPQYFKAVERSRMSEAVTLMANLAQAQQRKYLQLNHYTSFFTGLDVAPKDASGANHCTKGGTVGEVPEFGSDQCGDGNGFVLHLGGDVLNNGRVQAVRAYGERDGQYKYELSRYYAGTGVACHGTTKPGAELCADFCGMDELTTSEWCCTDGKKATSATEFEGSTCTAPTDAE